ncbi:MAG: hybrid sensor histidine kinase/response regulator, partial [Opitutaceae bacterium]
RRAAEEALRQANPELEARVEERTADLQRAVAELKAVGAHLHRARDEAVAASRAKDDFLAALSHELRTPLNPVLMLASDAAEDPALPEAVRADFAAIRKNVEVEAGLIDDLLDLTRISRGKLAFENRVLDVSRVLRDALAAVQPEVERKQLAVELDLTAPRAAIAGDAVRLQQIFWNVLRNAAKFTAEQGNIRVRTHNSGNCIVVTVADSGIGMTPDELERVFDPFSQGNHAVEGISRRFGGLGLGLTIARRLVEHHGGRITASSPGRGRGTSMAIEFPLAAEAPAGDEPHATTAPAAHVDGTSRRPVSPAAPAPALRILLVEDHAATRATLSRLLTRRRHLVSAAGTLADALALADAESFDLLVSDIGLPDGDGCALMQQLRERQPALQGIALSGYGMQEDLARSRAAGFARHFIKPINARALDKAIEELRA